MVQIPSSAPLQPGQPGQVVQPAQPKPSASVAPVAQTIEIEIPLPEPAGPQDQGPDTGHLQTAGMQANQLNFEQMSTRILEEVGKVQRLDKSTAIVVKIGERTLKIDASMLDKNKLQTALEQHFGDPAELGSPAHLASVQQLQDQSRPMLVQILQRPSADKTPLPEAALKQLQTLAQAFEKQVPAAIRQKYGLGPEQLKAWAETGIAPAGLKQLLQDYGPKGQNLYSALLHATGYGKAVTEARLKAGLIQPDQAQEIKAQFDGIKSEAGKRWESLNASAVSDTRKAAGTALSAYEAADKDLKALEAAAAAKTSKDPKALTADDEKALAAARAKVTKAREASQQTQQTAITVATSMKDVRLRRVEAAGSAAAPEGMRVKAAQAQLDAARAEASEGRVRQLSGSADPADALATSLQLVQDAEAMLPEWRNQQPIVTQRTEVLEAQHTALKSGVDAIAQTKRDADRLAALRTQLRGMPPAGQELITKQKAERVRLEGEIAKLASQLTDVRPADPLGGPTKPHEVRMLHLYGQGAAALEQTYAADIVLNNPAQPNPDQKERFQIASRRSRELHVEVAQASHDAIEAQQAHDRGKLSRETWLSHGRADATAELDAAKAEVAQFAKPKTSEEEKKLRNAQNRLAAAERVMREGEARSSDMGAGNTFSLLRAKALGEAFTPGASGADIPSPAQLAHDSEQRAVDRHALVGASYQTPQGPDPAWLGENGDFLRTRAQFAARSLEQTNVHAELAGQRDNIALRQAADDQARLGDVKAQLRDAKPGSPEHQALTSERKNLESRLHAFSDTLVGQLGAELADSSRRTTLHGGPNAPLSRLREIQAQQADNVAAVRQQQQALPPTATAQQKDILHQLNLQTTLAAAESISTYNPASAAAYLREASVAAEQLSDPNDRNQAQLKLKDRAVELYQAYVQHSHQSVDGAAALAAAVESTVYPHGKGAGLPDDTKTRWEALRRQSDPTALFSQHRAELRAALAQLSDQVGWDIEASYKIAVERGGLVMGTVARAARELARQGDIEGARNLLEQAVDKAIQASEQAEIAYRALPADKQEHYRAVLRSTAPEGEKQEALEQIFGYAEHGDAHANQGAISFASQALSVVGDSQTMQRAHQPGADYDLTASAQATADALEDPSSGLKPKAGTAAEAIADRYARQRARDEAYWNDPTVAIMASAVDEAALFIFTMGASTAVSLARAAITNMSRARSTLTTARRVYQGIEASRVGRTVIAVGSKAADYHHRFSQRLASFDGLLMNSGNLGRAGAQVFRFSRGMGRNLATEFSQKGLVWAAEQAGGKDSWLAWAAQTGGRLAGTGFSEIKGLDALGNGAWNVVETALTEAALPAFYKNDPKGLAEAKEGLHYLLMGVQTVHGMGKMRQQAKEQASLEADGLHTDLQRAGLELGPAQREALHAEVTRYHESLLHNQGSLKPEVHQEFAARVEAITGLKHLPADQQTALKAGLDTALNEYLAPYRIQVASTHSSFDSVKLADATPAKVKQATEAMAAELVKQGAALDHSEALKIARGQIAGQLLSQAQFGTLDLTQETTSLRTDMEASARRLVELGVVETPAQAAMVVRAEVRQHLADAAATLDTTTPAGKASWENLKQHYELTEQVSAALTQTGATLAQHHEALAGLPADKQAAADALLNQTLMGDMGRPLEAELAARLSQTLGEGNTALAHDLAATAITHWAKHLLVKEDLYSEHRGGGLMTLHDRHITLLKSLGMAQPQALEVARAEQRERAVEFYTGLCDAAGQPEHKNLVEAFVRDGFARFEQKIPTPEDLHAFETHVFHALLDAGFNGKQAPDLAVGIARSCMQTVLHQQSQAEARAHKDHLPIMEVLHLPAITVAGKPMTSLSEIRAYLHEGNLRDMGKMEAFYKAVGSWENLHKLSMALDPDIAARLHEARDAKVAEHWQSVEALAKAEGVTIARPYVGRGPGDKGYTGVYADVDLVIRITGSTDGTPVNPAKRALTELKLMRALQARLGESTPASGHDWDVNVYVTPQFMPLTQAGKGAPEAQLAQHHQNQLSMDFLQARLGFGERGEAWAGFKAEALKTAEALDVRHSREGKPANAAEQLRQGFAQAETRFRDYHAAVANELAALKANPKHQEQPEAVLGELARTAVRAEAEARLEAFLVVAGKHLEADTPAGVQARLDYFNLQMEMRATLPEAYIGNPAVYWGSRVSDGERKGAEAELADHAHLGLQGRVSHAQYILHWAVESHADLATRAWKAGKYDLRDQLFVNSINAGKGVNYIEMMDNPAYTQLVKQKQQNPGTIIPGDIPAKIPVSKTDRAVMEARAKATNPEQARAIWVKHFGSESAADKAMQAYLDVLTMTVQDSTARFLMSPRDANEAAHAHALGAVDAQLPHAPKLQAIVHQALLDHMPDQLGRALYDKIYTQVEAELKAAQSPDPAAQAKQIAETAVRTWHEFRPLAEGPGHPPDGPGHPPDGPGHPPDGPGHPPDGPAGPKPPSSQGSPAASKPAGDPAGPPSKAPEPDPEDPNSSGPATLRTGQPAQAHAPIKTGEPANGPATLRTGESVNGPSTARSGDLVGSPAAPPGPAAPAGVSATVSPPAATSPPVVISDPPAGTPLAALVDQHRAQEASLINSWQNGLPANQQAALASVGPQALRDLVRDLPHTAAQKQTAETAIRARLEAQGLPTESAAPLASRILTEGLAYARQADPVYRLREHIAISQPELLAALQPEHLTADEGKLQSQLGVFARSSPHYQALPTFEQLTGERQGFWTGEPHQAILFRAYGKSYDDQKELELHTALLRGENYSLITNADQIYGEGNVGHLGIEKAPAGEKHQHPDQVPGTDAELWLTLDGTSRNQVSRLSRRIGETLDSLRHQDQRDQGQEPDTRQDFGPIMVEEMAMLRDAKVIYFGLTGREAEHPNSVTTSELMAIINDPELLSKVVFFRFQPPSDDAATRPKGEAAAARTVDATLHPPASIQSFSAGEAPIAAPAAPGSVHQKPAAEASPAPVSPPTSVYDLAEHQATIESVYGKDSVLAQHRKKIIQDTLDAPTYEQLKKQIARLEGEIQDHTAYRGSRYRNTLAEQQDSLIAVYQSVIQQARQTDLYKQGLQAEIESVKAEFPVGQKVFGPDTVANNPDSHYHIAAYLDDGRVQLTRPDLTEPVYVLHQELSKRNSLKVDPDIQRRIDKALAEAQSFETIDRALRQLTDLRQEHLLGSFDVRVKYDQKAYLGGQLVWDYAIKGRYDDSNIPIVQRKQKNAGALVKAIKTLRAMPVYQEGLRQATRQMLESFKVGQVVLGPNSKTNDPLTWYRVDEITPKGEILISLVHAELDKERSQSWFAMERPSTLKEADGDSEAPRWLMPTSLVSANQARSVEHAIGQHEASHPVLGKPTSESRVWNQEEGGKIHVQWKDANGVENDGLRLTYDEYRALMYRPETDLQTFQQQFPFHQGPVLIKTDIEEGYTSARLENTGIQPSPWQVKAYQDGLATLERTWTQTQPVQVSQSQPGPILNLINPDPFPVGSPMLEIPGFKPMYGKPEDLKPGRILLDNKGTSWEVTHVGANGSEIQLSHVQEQQISGYLLMQEVGSDQVIRE